MAIKVTGFTVVDDNRDATVESLTTGSVQLTGGTGTQGTVTWNADEETLDLIQNGSTLQLGQELQVHARNNTGSLISNGTVVMATGTLGASGRITVAPYDNTTDVKYVVGVTTEDIADGTDGKVTSFGKVRGVNTSSWSEGSVLYTTTNGNLTSTVPTTGVKKAIAFVVNSHATNGTLMVRVNNIDEMKVEHGETAYGWGDHAGLYMDINAVTLPDQTGHAGQFLQTDGTNADWATVSLEAGGSLTGNLSDVKVQYGTSYAGTPLQGSFFFDSLNQKLKVYTGSDFVDAVPAGTGGGGVPGETAANATFRKYTYTLSNTTNAIFGSDDNGETLTYVLDDTQNVEVFVNGVKQVEGATNDYVATTGTAVAFTYNLPSGSVVEVQVYELLTQDAYYLKTETYTQTETNSQISTGLSSYLPLTGGTLTGNIDITGSSDLHITSTQNQPLKIESGNPNVWLDLISSAGTWSLGATSSNTFNVYDRINTASKLSLDNDGSLSIGLNPSTLAPGYMLTAKSPHTRADVHLTNSDTGYSSNDGVQFGIQSAGAYIWNFENSDVYFGTNNSKKWAIKADGHLLPNLDNSYDIGSEDKAVKNVFVEGDIRLQGNDSYIWTKNASDGVCGFWDPTTSGINGTGTIFSYRNSNGYVEIPNIKVPGMVRNVWEARSQLRVVLNQTTPYDLVSVTITPNSPGSKFLIMINIPVNTSDDSDAAAANANPYRYGRILRSVAGGSYNVADNMGVTQQGGQDSHIELSPNRVSAGTGDDYASQGGRYRMEHKASQVTDTPSYTMGQSIEYKLTLYHTGGTAFFQAGEPQGFASDDNYPCMPWGFTIMEIMQ